MATFRLMRSESFLVFSTFNPEGSFWVSTLAAAHGGGSMYQPITVDEFEELWSLERPVSALREYFNRSWDPKGERAVAERHGLEAAVDLHLPKLRSSERFVRSVVETEPFQLEQSPGNEPGPQKD